MKRACLALAGMMALVFAGANLISQPQVIANGVLEDLKFERQRDPAGELGAPSEFKITRATLDYLTKLHNQRKTIEVSATGAIRVE